MIGDNRMHDRAIGAGIGAATVYGVMTFGTALLSSGWTSALCASGLLVSAVWVAAGKALQPRPARRDAPPGAPSYVRAADGDWSRSPGPVEWLRRTGALTKGPEDRAAFLARKLGADLRALPPAPDPAFEDLSVTILAHALAQRAAEGPRRTNGVSWRMLGELDRIHASVARPERGLAIEGLWARLLTDLEPSAGARRILDEAQSRHATQETLLIALLDRARKRSGCLATAEFLWLKGVDRPMFYALNNLGRRTFHVEGLAAIDHYRHELLAGRPLARPHVGCAVRSLLAEFPEPVAESA